MGSVKKDQIKKSYNDRTREVTWNKVREMMLKRHATDPMYWPSRMEELLIRIDKLA